jgi:hypothetical protein
MHAEHMPATFVEEPLNSSGANNDGLRDTRRPYTLSVTPANASNMIAGTTVSR